ncbi:MAG: glycosyltransferase family 39 protein [Alphaproteobacteria bacterium]
MPQALRQIPQWINGLDIWTREHLAWLAEQPRLAAAFLVLLCLALYLPGIATLPVTDRDEARFAQASKQMLETGNYVDIRFQENPRYKKPIGIYWLQSASVKTLSPGDFTQIWAYRVPSLLGIIVGVLLTWWAALPIFGRKNALLAAALLASALTLTMEARIAKSDAVLFACIVAMQGALARLYLLPSVGARSAALFWGALGAGVLIKGPVAPAIAALTIATLLIFDRDRSWLKNMRSRWGVPMMLAITLPWFIAIGIASKGAFFQQAIGEDFLAKLASGKEKHWGPPGFYFVLFWWSFWPAALVVPGGVAIWLWRNAKVHRKALFLLAWIIPFWIVLEAVPTKLPHYAMPLYPAIAMGAAWVLNIMLEGQISRLRSYTHAAALWLFVALAQAGFLAFLLVYFQIVPSVWEVLIALIFIAGALATAWAAWHGRFYAALATGAICAVLLYTAAFRMVVPSVDQVWISRQIAEVVTALRPCARAPVVSSFREPSTVFLLGTHTALTSRKNVLPLAKKNALALPKLPGEMSPSDQLVVTDAETLKKDQSTKLPVLACIKGFNINGGKPVHLRVLGMGSRKVYASCPVPEQYACDGDDAGH